MSLKAFVYSKDGIIHETDVKEKFAAYQAESINRGLGYVESESFPPMGFVLATTGKLVPKTDRQKIESGELPLSDLILAKCAEIEKLCRDKITGGIVSSALGEPYLYPSDEIDQQNLAAKVISARAGVFKCTKISDGIKDWYPHTAAQFKAAFQDGDSFITDMLKNSTILQTNLRKVTTYEGVKNFDINVGW